MRKRPFVMLSLIISVFVIATTIYAQGVLKSSDNSPKQVVSARKFAMRMIGANVGDFRKKIEAGNIKGVAANAGGIASLATFLPLVYKETYPDVYPVKGSKYFYKATLPDIEAAFEDLRVQAEGLMKFAAGDDKSGVEAQARKVRGTCGACHKPTRGKY
jgi:hypothetical protein